MIFIEQSKDQLYKSSNDTEFSGSTLNSILIIKKKLYICNVGDSRSVLYKNKNFETIIQLSQEHKPNIIEEKKRILKKNGILKYLKDQNGNDIGPLRVYLPGDSIPGLAMTRSIGDLIASKIGITWKPNINFLEINAEMINLIIIATDGIWDVLNNQQVIDIIKNHSDNLELASKKLLKKAINIWKKYDDKIIDDITFVILSIKFNNIINQQQMKNLKYDLLQKLTEDEPVSFSDKKYFDQKKKKQKVQNKQQQNKQQIQYEQNTPQPRQKNIPQPEKHIYSEKNIKQINHIDCISKQLFQELEDKYIQRLKDNQNLIQQLKFFNINLRKILDFFFKFIEQIITLPNIIEVNKSKFNFSFQKGQLKSITKDEFIKTKVFDFLEDNQEFIHDMQYTDQLVNILEIFQQQQKQIEESKIIENKKPISIYQSELNQKVNVFRESLTQNLNTYLQKNENIIEDKLQIKNNIKQQIEIVIAQYRFKAEIKDKDLDIQKNDQIQVISKNQNGWWVGINLRTGLKGYFPSNYTKKQN